MTRTTAHTVASHRSSGGRIWTWWVVVCGAGCSGWLLLHPSNTPATRIWWIGVAVGLTCSVAAWRRWSRGIPWHTFLAHTGDFHLLAAACLYVLAAQHARNNGITSDGCLYFAHLRSLVFDRDLSIGPELQFLRLPPRPHHTVPIGPAAVWAPLYVIVAIVDRAGRALGRWSAPGNPAITGLSGPYVGAVLLSSYAAAIVGIFVIHMRVRREVGRLVALLTSLLLLGATTLAWYIVYEPSMTHAVSFGVIAVSLVASEAWLAQGQLTRQRAVALGFLFGLAAIVRPEDALFAIFPVVTILFPRSMLALSGESKRRALWWAVLGAAPLLILQAVMAYALLSQQSFKLAGDEGYLSVSQSRWAGVLFSSWHGLFSWTPVAYVALIGTFFYARRNWRWAVPALAVFVAMCWINGSAHDWAGGWSFGGRRFTSTLVGLAPGLAAVIDLLRRRPVVLLTPVVAGVLVWNVLLMTQYQKGLLPRDEPVRFDTLVHQQADLYLEPPYFYPFSFPANVWFAWREKLPIDRYDLLAPEPLRQEMYLPLNDWGSRFLLDGWQGDGGDAFGSRRWLYGPKSEILVPLDVPADRSFVIDIEARAEGPAGLGQVELNVDANGQSLGRIILDVGASEPTRTSFVTPPEAQNTLWRRGYNRVTITLLKQPMANVPIAIYALRVAPGPKP